MQSSSFRHTLTYRYLKQQGNLAEIFPRIIQHYVGYFLARSLGKLGASLNLFLVG
jgi:hypothetical protein